MDIPNWLIFIIYALAWLAYLLFIVYIANENDEESDAQSRGRTRRRRRVEGVCPGCETVVWYIPVDEETPLLVSGNCECGERNFPPGYGARDQLPKYVKGDMAPPYEPYESL